MNILQKKLKFEIFPPFSISHAAKTIKKNCVTSTIITSRIVTQTRIQIRPHFLRIENWLDTKTKGMLAGDTDRGY